MTVLKRELDASCCRSICDARTKGPDMDATVMCASEALTPELGILHGCVWRNMLMGGVITMFHV